MTTTLISNSASGSHSQVSAPAQPTRVVDLFDEWSTLQPRWDEFVQRHPKGCIFHTSPMIRTFLHSKGNKPVAIASVANNGHILALLVSVRVQTLPRPLGGISSRSIFYAEPLCHDHPDSMKALYDLVQFHDSHVGRSILFAEVRPLFEPGVERIALERAGYEYLDYLNYLNDVTLPVNAMWKNLHRSAHYSVRQCEKRGLEAREVPADIAIEELYVLLQQSYRHSGVPLAHRSLFEATVRELLPHGMVRCFAVYKGGAAVAMDIILTYKGRAFLWYGGVSRSTEGSPCSLLRWHELKWAHEEGYSVCDSGGAGWPNVPYGVRDFKRKFGGELVHFGRYRKVFAPRTLAMAEKVYNLKRKIFTR